MTRKHNKFTTIRDRKDWAQKIMYKHIELCTVVKRKAKQHVDIV